MDTFDIKYKNQNGEVIKTDTVKRVKRKQLADLILLQQDLVYAFYKTNGGIGSIIADSNYWNIMEKIAKMLPVVGEEKVGINLSAIEDDLSQLTAIFFTQSLDENGNLIIGEDIFKQSLISELHKLDYFDAGKKAGKRIMKESQEDQLPTM
jgi:hypothetical protein